MQGTLKVLDGTGHTTIAYNTEQGVTKEAIRVLGDHIRHHSALFDGQTKERLYPIDLNDMLETHEEVILVPMMAGG